MFNLFRKRKPLPTPPAELVEPVLSEPEKMTVAHHEVVASIRYLGIRHHADEDTPAKIAYQVEGYTLALASSSEGLRKTLASVFDLEGIPTSEEQLDQATRAAFNRLHRLVRLDVKETQKRKPSFINWQREKEIIRASDY